jgi:alpha-tubulin suppressor-like RCC1 family protein
MTVTIGRAALTGSSWVPEIATSMHFAAAYRLCSSLGVVLAVGAGCRATHSAPRAPESPATQSRRAPASAPAAGPRTLSTSLFTVLVEQGAVRTVGGRVAYDLTSGRLLKMDPDDAHIASTTGIVEVGTAWDHTCVRSGSGEVRCWGNGNRHRENGAGADAAPIPMPDAPAELAVGEYHACARLSDGSVTCWGSDAHRQLGYPPPEQCVTGGGCSGRALRVEGVERAIMVAAGEWHTCALLADATVRCWGDNASGQLGAPLATTASGAAVSVGRIDRAMRLVLSSSNSCVVTADGDVSCWGTTTACGTKRVAQPTPERLPCLSAVKDIGFGFHHACVLGANGTVSCWGENRDGRLGLAESVVSTELPRQVPGVHDVVELSVGLHATCARTRAGVVHCWGEDYGLPAPVLR